MVAYVFGTAIFRKIRQLRRLHIKSEAQLSVLCTEGALTLLMWGSWVRTPSGSHQRRKSFGFLLCVYIRTFIFISNAERQRHRGFFFTSHFSLREFLVLSTFNQEVRMYCSCNGLGCDLQGFLLHYRKFLFLQQIGK